MLLMMASVPYQELFKNYHHCKTLPSLMYPLALPKKLWLKLDDLPVCLSLMLPPCYAAHYGCP